MFLITNRNIEFLPTDFVESNAFASVLLTLWNSEKYGDAVDEEYEEILGLVTVGGIKKLKKSSQTKKAKKYSGI